MDGLVHIAGLVIWTKKNRMTASAHVGKGYGRRVKGGEVVMKERLSDRVIRKTRERYDKVLKWIIRKAVQKHDDLNYGAFMAYSWGRDEVTDYHITAERSYKGVHIYGTRVERLIDGEWVLEE